MATISKNNNLGRADWCHRVDKTQIIVTHLFDTVFLSYSG